MNLEEIVGRLEDLAVEEDLPELQGLANALVNMPDNQQGCKGCEEAALVLSRILADVDHSQHARRAHQLYQEERYREHMEMRKNMLPAYYFAPSTPTASVTGRIVADVV